MGVGWLVVWVAHAAGHGAAHSITRQRTAAHSSAQQRTAKQGTAGLGLDIRLHLGPPLGCLSLVLGLSLSLGLGLGLGLTLGLWLELKPYVNMSKRAGQTPPEKSRKNPLEKFDVRPVRTKK